MTTNTLAANSPPAHRRRERNVVRSVEVLPPDVETKVGALRTLDGAAQAAAVTAMLSHSRTGLLAAIAAHDLPQIVEWKAKGAAIQEIAKQVRLGKELRLDADEFVRRAERGLGVAIREGQAAGTVLGPGKKNFHAGGYALAKTRLNDELIRDGWYYIVDGQHRVRAAIMFLGDSSQQVQCHVYENLTCDQEANLFLELNNTKKQGPMSRYKVALTAGKADELDVERICRSLDLRIGLDKSCEEIGCVTAILAVYRKHGPASFSFAMRVIRDAYGFDGFKRQNMSALALIKDRYGDRIDEAKLTERLAKSGIVALNQQAKAMKEATGNPADQCYAHAMIQFYNQRNAHRVDPWWNLSVVGVA